MTETVKVYNEPEGKRWRCPECDMLNPMDWMDCRDCSFVWQPNQ